MPIDFFPARIRPPGGILKGSLITGIPAEIVDTNLHSGRRTVYDLRKHPIAIFLVNVKTLDTEQYTRRNILAVCLHQIDVIVQVSFIGLACGVINDAAFEKKRPRDQKKDNRTRK
jgi:hypothetical protein